MFCLYLTMFLTYVRLLSSYYLSLYKTARKAILCLYLAIFSLMFLLLSPYYLFIYNAARKAIFCLYKTTYLTNVPSLVVCLCAWVYARKINVLNYF